MKQLLILAFCSLGLISKAQLFNTISNADKVYGLSMIWQEANYNFVFINKVDLKRWDSDYKRLIKEVQETKSDYEYYRLLQKFCASLKDGHTSVNFPNSFYFYLANGDFGDYRIITSNIGGKAIITKINQSKRNEVPVGSEIIEVNGMSTPDFLASEVTPYISSSTDYILEDISIQNMFLSIKGKKFDVKLKLPNGEEKILNLTSGNPKETAMYPEQKQLLMFDFKWIDKDIAYLEINTFNDPKVDTLFVEKLPELYKAKKLIIDIRNNSGGSTNIGEFIMQYLTNDTVLYGSKSVSRLHIPVYKAWGNYVTEEDTVNNEWATQAYLTSRNKNFHSLSYSPNKNNLDAKRIVVPTAILIGHNTVSAAEDFLIFTDNQKHIVKIGEPSNGSTGQPLFFDLPGGGRCRICTKMDTYPNGKEFVGYGVQPDIKVSKTLEDYKENRDPVLQRAIEYLKNKQ